MVRLHGLLQKTFNCTLYYPKSTFPGGKTNEGYRGINGEHTGIEGHHGNSKSHYGRYWDTTPNGGNQVVWWWGSTSSRSQELDRYHSGKQYGTRCK